MAAMRFLDVRGGRNSPSLCGSREETLILRKQRGNPDYTYRMRRHTRGTSFRCVVGRVSIPKVA
jgi:hypothetical protein